ncbi:MAG: ABC transporter substrate-binding protein [Blautia sp.]|nr:ABC transporter substrate-binding protein [Blautia sp.]
MKRKAALALCAALVLGSTTPAYAAGTLTFGCQNYGGGGVDPAEQINTAWNAMRYGVTECLFKFTDSMEVEPWLAESYEVSDDHTTWTIKLKDGIKFSTGADMTASAVKASFDRLKEDGPNGSASPDKYLEYDAEITADDDANTITIVTQTAYPDLTKNLAYPVLAIVDVAETEDYSHGTIGTGPYVIDTYTDEVGYTLKKNENYREEVPYDDVTLYYMGDASAKAMALQNGQVDLVENITNVADIQSLQESDAYTVDIANGVRCGFAYINQKGVLGNDTLRKAVIMAVDDETICNSALIGGLYEPGFSVLPSNLAYGYDTLENPNAFDAEAAAALLDEAGIVDTDGDGIRELDGENIVLKYIYYDNRLLKEFAQAQHMYLNQIGIEVEESEQDSDTEWNMMVNGEYDLCASNWTTVGTGDPTEYLDNWYGKSSANYCGFQNDEYDELYEQLRTELDNEKRTEIITRLQQILVDNGAALIDGYYKSSMIYSQNVGYAHIHTADYYWLSTEITPAE